MKSINYPEEKGMTRINGHELSWILRRSKGASCFGIQGSRIFELTLMKDGKTIAKYDRAWDQKVAKEDEEGAIALSYLLRTYGQEKRVKKRGEKDNE